MPTLASASHLRDAESQLLVDRAMQVLRAHCRRTSKLSRELTARRRQQKHQIAVPSTRTWPGLLRLCVLAGCLRVDTVCAGSSRRHRGWRWAGDLHDLPDDRYRGPSAPRLASGVERMGPRLAGRQGRGGGRQTLTGGDNLLRLQLPEGVAALP